MQIQYPKNLEKTKKKQKTTTNYPVQSHYKYLTSNIVLFTVYNSSKVGRLVVFVI